MEFPSKHKIPLILIIVLFLMIVSTACDNSDIVLTNKENTQLIPAHQYDPDTIEQSVASEIKRAYYQKLVSESRIDPGYGPDSPEDLWICWYVGNFNGCEVVMMAGDDICSTQAHRPVEVAGYEIVFASGQPVYVYKDSGFYTVKEAYDGGLITKSDVYSIGVQVGVDFTESYPTQ